jgi:hypothetical protein
MSDPVVIGVALAAGVVVLGLFAYATRKKGSNHVYEDEGYGQYKGGKSRRRSLNRSRKK